MGLWGSGDEINFKGARPSGQPPIGSLALACMERCKQPVILVKSGEAPPSGTDRIKRVGNNHTPGINVMVSMDTSAVSRKAFECVHHYHTYRRCGGLRNGGLAPSPICCLSRLLCLSRLSAWLSPSDGVGAYDALVLPPHQLPSG